MEMLLPWAASERCARIRADASVAAERFCWGLLQRNTMLVCAASGRCVRVRADVGSFAKSFCKGRQCELLRQARSARVFGQM